MYPLEQPITFQALALGRHLTIEYYDCNAQTLADVEGMKKIFTEAAVISGATVLETSFHAFQPQGVSGIVVICESHFAVHAWPEHDYAAVDIFTCGDQIDFELAAETLREKLSSRSMVISHALSRGLIGQNGAVLHEKPSENTVEGTLSWQQRYRSADAWGMLASVDVYECPAEVLTPGNISCVLQDLSAVLGAKFSSDICGSEFTADGKGGGFRFMRMLDAGTVTGRYSLERQTFYCDIFLGRFFDPRKVSESLINTLNGRYYRLQVAMRQ